MSIDVIPIGSLSTNCYVVVSEEKNVAIVIDPGDESERLFSSLSSFECVVDMVFLTHGHFDHILGVDPLFSYLKKTQQKEPNLFIHQEDISLLADAKRNLSEQFFTSSTVATPASCFRGEDCFSFGKLRFSVIHTPGHSRGSSCLFFENEKVLFTGDTLFAQGIGRFDLPGGDKKQLLLSLERLSKLADDLIIYPGHGQATTIKEACSSQTMFALLE